MFSCNDVVQSAGRMITVDALSRSQKALFVLLKASINNKEPEESFLGDFSESEWRAVYRIAIEQGVMAIVFDAVMRLPEKLRPQRTLKLNWAVNVDVLEKRYKHQIAVANEVTDIFREEKMRMVLFKGLSLAQYYPIPSHREFGDLDIYLFRKYKDGNKKLIQKGAKKKHSDPKHTALSFKGLLIENHNTFLTLHRYPHLKKLNNRLAVLCEKSAGLMPCDNIQFPSPDFSTLFMMCHAVIHFPSSIVLRHFCDFLFFWRANHSNVDISEYKNVLADAGLTEVADAFMAITVRFLGLEQELAPAFKSNPELEDKILLSMLNPVVLKKKNPSSLDILKFKYKVLKSRRWKYELVNPGKYGIFIAKSALYYLFNLKLLFKLK